jgi:transcriptional regulator of met regulon
VCHQSAQKLGKDLEIGEIYVPLKDLTQLQSKKEVRIIEELKHRPNSKVSIKNFAFIFFILETGQALHPDMY